MSDILVPISAGRAARQDHDPAHQVRAHRGCRPNWPTCGWSWRCWSALRGSRCRRRRTSAAEEARARARQRGAVGYRGSHPRARGAAALRCRLHRTGALGVPAQRRARRHQAAHQPQAGFGAGRGEVRTGHTAERAVGSALQRVLGPAVRALGEAGGLDRQIDARMRIPQASCRAWDRPAADPGGVTVYCMLGVGGSQFGAGSSCAPL